MNRNIRRAWRATALSLVAGAALSACAPLLIGGALVGGSMVATDRRTSGAQVEDEVIELKAGKRIRETLGERGQVSVTSYNRIVLITGIVTDAADKTAVEEAIGRIENVQSVVNEVAVGIPRSITGRSSDALITTKVKASLIDAKDLFSNAIKVVTSQDVVYLMGRVTEREATRAAEVARGVGGVQKVVRVFELISEAELANTQPKAPPKP
ncbi:MAG TPA: BON domain-containing protein [Caldimonas sp.]